MPNSILGNTGGSHYRLLKRLGGGGCADVFLAETLTASRHHEPYVVAKCLRTPTDEPALETSLADEAELISRFDHPGIPRLLDLAESDEGPCLILECLHGIDLQDVLHEVLRTGKRVPLAIAVRIAADVAAALHHAHERATSD